MQAGSGPGEDVCIFHEIAVQPMNVLGVDTSVLPELLVPLPSELQDEHKLSTSLVSEALRIVRSSDGFVYVFERGL